VIKHLIYHRWADGVGFVDLGPDAKPDDIERVKEAWKIVAEEGTGFIGGVEITIVEHPGNFTAIPLNKEEIYDQFFKDP
jgi:hypothetical protein